MFLSRQTGAGRRTTEFLNFLSPGHFLSRPYMEVEAVRKEEAALASQPVGAFRYANVPKTGREEGGAKVAK